MPNIVTYTDPAALLAKVRPDLERQEAINSLILGIATSLAEHPDFIRAQPYLSVTQDEMGKIILVAVNTPPQMLLLAAERDVPQSAIDQLYQNLRAGGWSPPAVSGRNPLGEQFVKSWAAATGRTAHIKLRKRLYELRQVIFPAHPPSGFLRPATLDELDLVSAWREAFSYESLHETPLPDFRESLIRQINAGTLYLWDDHGPVSMAAAARPTAHGTSINSVYTPPELRGRGYASACVAALSQRILGSGKQYCALFTDLDYPISNSIYQKIGYRPLCDFNDYRFEDGF